MHLAVVKTYPKTTRKYLAGFISSFVGPLWEVVSIAFGNFK
jgi:hypothetical protein